MRILLVDEILFSSQWIQKSLTQAGFDVLVANSFQSALQLLANETIDMVLSDSVISKYSVRDLRQTCAELPRYEGVYQVIMPKFVILSTLDPHDLQQQLKEDHISGFLPKPFDIQEFRQLLEDLGNRKSQQNFQVLLFDPSESSFFELQDLAKQPSLEIIMVNHFDQATILCESLPNLNCIILASDKTDEVTEWKNKLKDSTKSSAEWLWKTEVSQTCTEFDKILNLTAVVEHLQAVFDLYQEEQQEHREKTALVVDHLGFQVARLKQILNRLGYKVLKARSPEEAELLLKEHDISLLLSETAFPEGVNLKELIEQHQDKLKDVFILGTEGSSEYQTKTVVTEASESEISVGQSVQVLPRLVGFSALKAALEEKESTAEAQAS